MILKTKNVILSFSPVFICFLIISISFWVIFFGSWAYPLNWTKSILFRILFSALIFIFLYKLIFKKIESGDILTKIKAVFIPLTLLFLFIVVSLISIVFSADITYSVWGTPIRGDGFVNFLFYFLFGIVLFFILSKENWQKLFIFLLIVGFLVSLIAIFQNFSLFNNLFRPVSFRPSSTMGNPNFLSNYLILVFFVCLSLFAVSKNLKSKIAYFLLLIFFSLVIIFITQTRSAMLGTFLGLLWFFVFYPKSSIKNRFSFAVIFILFFFGLIFLNANFDKLFSHQPIIVKSGLGRMLSLTEDPANTIKSRISAWKISLNALKDRPIFGYGPENFEIAFDKYYDSSLPEIGGEKMNIKPVPQWWDRAHNFLFDISVTSGMPALILFLLFFVFLILELQKLKKKKTESSLFANSMQAAFIAYLVSLLFSFSSFDDYVVLFFLIGFSFHLIYSKNSIIFNANKEISKVSNYFFQYRILVIGLCFVFISLFVYLFNIKPFLINHKIDSMLNEFVIGSAEKAINEAVLINGDYGIMNNYARDNSSEIINKYIGQEGVDPIKGAELLRKSIFMLQDNIIRSPNRLRYWLLAGESINSLIEKKMMAYDNYFSLEELAALKKEGNYYFENASKLSLKRQEIYKEWAKLGLIAKDYKLAEEKAEKCIFLNTLFGECYWLEAIAKGYQKDKKSFEYYLTLAKANDYSIDSENSLSILVNMQLENNNYEEVINVCNLLILKTEEIVKKNQIYQILKIAYEKTGDYPSAKNMEIKIKEFER